MKRHRFYRDFPSQGIPPISPFDPNFVGDHEPASPKVRTLYLSPASEPLPLEDHLRQALDNSLFWYAGKAARREYADSEYMFLRLAKDHPDLRDVADGFEAAEIIERALGVSLEEFAPGRNTYADLMNGGAESTPLRQQIWSLWTDIRPAVLSPVEGDLMRQAWNLVERQPVCSGICPDGDDHLHRLYGIAYWLGQLRDGKPFGLDQIALSKILGVTQGYVSTLIKLAKREGHLELAESGPQDANQARRERKVMEYRWLSPLSPLGGPKSLTSESLNPTLAERSNTYEYLRVTSDRDTTREEEGEKEKNLSISTKRGVRKERHFGCRRKTKMSEEEFLSHFGRSRKVGTDKLRVPCPGHDDRNPSLDILFDRVTGKRVLYCHAGCEIQRIVDAAGLRMEDLFSDSNSDRWR